MMKIRYIWIGFLLLFASCTKEPVDNVGGGNGGDDNTLNEWIFNTLRGNYLWSLTDEWIRDNASPQYDQGYETFFRSVLQQPVLGYGDAEPHDGYYYQVDDRGTLAWQPYSYIEEDDGAARSVSGTHSFGFEFGTFRVNTTTVYAYVIYVVPGSPADGKLQRGDWIGTVNGKPMTINNYTQIYPEMIGSMTTNNSLELGLFDITFRSRNEDYIHIDPPVARPETVTLTAGAANDDPVHYHAMIQGTSIAYLVYNAFENDPAYERSLKDAFSYFGSQGATELILDLRYNPGGYNTTCVLLGSLIRPAVHAGSEVFVKYKSREELGTERFDSYIDYFYNTTSTGVDAPGFNRVFVLTSSRTASASEMLINSLRGAASRPVEVHVVGDTTAGKNVGSSFQETTVDGKKYTMHPIMFQNFNAQEKSEFANGFLPGTSDALIESYQVNELVDGMVAGEPYRLKAWGSADDPLLARAVELITGIGRRSVKKSAGVDSRSGAATVQLLPESSLDRKPVRGSIRTAE